MKLASVIWPVSVSEFPNQSANLREDISSFIYFPILPWFGVTLLGVGAGNILYKNGIRQFKFPDISHLLPVKVVSLLGKNSLIIYLLHQPILAGMIIYVVPVISP